MNLKTYFEKNQLKPTPWAVENGISPAIISRYLNGVTKINPENAKRIEQATGGVVTAVEILYPKE